MQDFGGSLGEVRAGLTEVAARLEAAYRCARTAEQRLAEATAVLAELDRSHQGHLLPRELLGANEELARCLSWIMGGADSVAAIESRL
jgi:hypothetical protein